MTDKLREAAKAALDWLESTKTQSMEEYLQVIDSLKAALAEPEQKLIRRSDEEINAQFNRHLNEMEKEWREKK